MRDLNQYLKYFNSLENVSQENKDSVRWFLDECAAEGLSEIRQCKYIFGFKTLLTKFVPEKIDLSKAQKEHLKRIVADIHRSEYSESTKCFLKQCLKKFYKLQNDGEYPNKVQFFRTTEKANATVKKEDLYSRDELQRVLSQLRNIRDRAYIMTQYEAAARSGEVLKTTISDVRFDENGDFIRLSGVKNMPTREIQLVEAGYYLKEWLRMHPCGGDPFHVKDPQAPLWVKLEQFSCQNCGVSGMWHKHQGCQSFEPQRIEQMTLHNIYKNWRTACKKAAVRKRSYRLYNLRHTRITEVSKFMSHEQLTKFAGWKPGSGQFNVYVHLTSEDVNAAIREQYNLNQQEAEQQPVTCKVCWHQNPPQSTECRNCRRPLTVEATFKQNEVKDALAVLADLQEQGKLKQLMQVANHLKEGSSDPSLSHYGTA